MNSEEITTNEGVANNDNVPMQNDTMHQYDESNASSDKTTNDNTVNQQKKTTRGKATIDMSAASSSSSKENAEQVMPSYPGGEQSLEKFVEDNLQYPQEAIDNNIEGRVLVTFDVDENGKIFRPSIASEKIGYGLEEEALRVIKSMPQWNPGKLKGKNVKTKFTLPIIYQII